MIASVFAASALSAQTVRVPFVGCAQDGQAGPLEAPKGADKTLQVAVGAAKRLAFYTTGGGFGVLAPRGWFCFGYYGSGGGALAVADEPIGPDAKSGPLSGPLTGSAIEVQSIEGGGSGILSATEVWARVFPAYWPIIKGLIKNDDLPADQYTFGPYKADKLIVQKANLVRFQTPPNSEGLGTMGHFKANGDPIDGVAILVGQNPGLLMLRVLLPRELRDLAPIIIREFEREHK